MTLDHSTHLNHYMNVIAQQHASINEQILQLQKELTPNDFAIHKAKKEKLHLKDMLVKLHAHTLPNIIA
ncbi:MAG: YdcH family protein [Alphaproteobacteria bacterium]|nr:YdcH family protein [Alphaproteobacteria bacterium]